MNKKRKRFGLMTVTGDAAATGNAVQQPPTGPQSERLKESLASHLTKVKVGQGNLRFRIWIACMATSVVGQMLGFGLKSVVIAVAFSTAFAFVMPNRDVEVSLRPIRGEANNA